MKTTKDLDGNIKSVVVTWTEIKERLISTLQLAGQTISPQVSIALEAEGTILTSSKGNDLDLKL